MALRQRFSRRWSRPGALITAIAAIAVGVVAPTALAASSAGAAAIPGPDGLSQATAAASCWEIKQVTPSAPSGVYWLETPALGAPGQFYCDQTTNGGGWVLVGRGRENWGTTAEGLGTPADVSSTITGTAAFAPKQLSVTTIDALNNNQPISSMTDGIRLRRALDQAGTTFQESTFTITSPLPQWDWMFNNQQRVGTWNIGGVTGSGGTTASFGSGNTTNEISNLADASHANYAPGFGYGPNTTGSTSATSYIWSPTSTSGYARPFTQVFIRPKLLSSTIFNTIPDSGTTAKAQQSVASSFADPTVWGVSGLGAGPNSVEGSNEVSAFAEGNGIVYVGGNFTSVQQSSAGQNAVSQSYLAAFDVKTDAWISTFRPTFNAQVKSLAVLPNGDVAVGGYFTQANGEARGGFTVLNPTTGANDETYQTMVYNHLSGGVVNVRGLDVQGNWLYLGGDFTHLSADPTSTQVYARSGARISVANGTPDGAWNPTFNGNVISVDASSQGDRVYFAGYFTQANTSTAVKDAAISTASGAANVPWTTYFSNAGANYQQAILEVGNRVWTGGAEHMIWSYDRNTLQLASTNEGDTGGDGQALASNGSVVYGGCHCFWTEYAGSSTWSNIGTNWTQAYKINSFGAWDATTGAALPQFSPTVSQRHGAGSWALFVDSTGTLWTGGDYNASTLPGFKKQWSGGLVRFPLNDSKAPTTPTALSVSATTSGDVLNWGKSTDDSGSLTYQVLRNDRVVATTTSTTITLPTAPAGTKYFVRAADASNNWSASTSAATATTAPPPPSTTVLVAPGSTWSYYYDATNPASGWKQSGYDTTGWSSGAAPIGYGTTDVATQLTTTDTPKPVTSYYRDAISVPDVSKLGDVTITTRADDGIVVYVNGDEVLRSNIDPGTVTSTTYANKAVNSAAALSTPVTVTIPASDFVNGSNVISAEVHSNYRTTPGVSFELGAVAAAPDSNAPPPPVTTKLIPAGSTWSYYYDATDPASGWTQSGYDTTGWSSGAAPIGFGTTDVATQLTTTDSPKPITSYYRKTFQVADTSQLGTVTITTRADDGVIVYVNGVEVQRTNIDPGPVTSSTDANKAVNSATALSTPITFTVPASAFSNGANVITAEVHANYRSTPSVSFELTATSVK